jgi:hypothetical protein
MPGDLPFHRWARRWLGEQWPEWQPRTRRSAVEALARLVPLVVRSSAPPVPEGLRSYLTATLGDLGAVDPEHDCERWLERHSLPLGQLTRDLLAGVEARLALA